MSYLKNLVLLLLSFFVVIACSSNNNQPWSTAIPQEAPFVIIPPQQAQIDSSLKSFGPFLGTISSADTKLLAKVDSSFNSSIGLNAIMLYPGADNELAPVWIAQAPSDFIDKLKEKYYQRFTQNHYYFGDTVIQKLHLDDRLLFATQLQEMVLFSESSLGIEETIRAYNGDIQAADLSNLSLKANHIVMNTPALDKSVRQLARVTYHPQIKDAFKHMKPTLLSLNHSQDNFQFSGTIPLNIDEDKNGLMQTLADTNAAITLDKYISSNAAGFGLFRQNPGQSFTGSLPDTSRVDQQYLTQENKYASIAQHVGKKLAMVLYAESGFLTEGEQLFLRKLTNTDAIKNELSQLVDDGVITKQNENYYIQSRILAQLFGSPLCTFSGFYLRITDDVAVLSKRKELTDVIPSDKNRRRTMFYERQFRDIKSTLPEKMSSLFVTNRNFRSFINPFLLSDSYADTLLSRFEKLTISTELTEKKDSLQFRLRSHRAEKKSVPYEEQWLYDAQTDLSGPPVLANIGGSSRKEIILASSSGKVSALAADGTPVFEVDTGGDQPVGSPVVFDWYDNGQKVVLLAAGNKLYGWNAQGEPLPKFPFELNEQITAPLLLSDINGVGRAEALIATADRKLHALNGRGVNLTSWPVTTNNQITTRPAVGEFQNEKTVFAFTGNAAHAWRGDGTSPSDFPIFIDAPLQGSPVIFKEKVLANASDGNVYAIGPSRLFEDSLNVFNSDFFSTNEAIYVSEGTLEGSPKVADLKVQSEGKSYEGNKIITTDANGSLFVFTSEGHLLFNHNMGQPAQSGFSPFVTDLNRDGTKDIVTLGQYGRLYIWQSSDGQQLNIVPSTSMNYPIIADIDQDGYNELLAQTEDGIQCWTIYGE